MLRKGDIEDWLKAVGKDVKKMSWKEKIKFYFTPHYVYIFSWLFFYLLSFFTLLSLFGFEVFL